MATPPTMNGIWTCLLEMFLMLEQGRKYRICDGEDWSQRRLGLMLSYAYRLSAGGVLMLCIIIFHILTNRKSGHERVNAG
ncbi:hypothetical protein PSTT_04215 [Puccinia striiformis]|uniref:Uncharacterized protein n=1 Tax=Puccinia striiformis TaxID=27350 RepID=A0A2S4VSR5_9BASI|nr:hypothetical protein PSTT_04215 [Puccinia striiformis]